MANELTAAAGWAVTVSAGVERTAGQAETGKAGGVTLQVDGTRAEWTAQVFGVADAFEATSAAVRMFGAELDRAGLAMSGWLSTRTTINGV